MIKTFLRWVVVAGCFASFTKADPLPAGWSSTDVGGSTPAGTQSYTPATAGFDLTGAGSDIWGAADQFHYAYQSWTGDGQWIVQVSTVQNTNAWAKAGIMVRADLTAGSANVLLALTAGNGVTFQRRKVSSGSSVYNSIPGTAAPGWLKLVRRGDQFDAYTSTDGQTWTYWMTDFVSLPAAVQVGLAITSHDSGVLASASFAQFAASSVATGYIPAGWTSADVGAPTPTGDGGYTSAATRFDLIGSGTDIWGAADQFHYVYQLWTGDGQWVVQVASIQNTSTWAKAGIMVRTDLTAGSVNAMLALTPGNGATFQRRQVSDGASICSSIPGVAASGWLKLVRKRNQFDSYISPDGQSWSYLTSDLVAMPATVLVGLAVTSHHTGALADAGFAQFAATTPLAEDFPNGWTSQDIGSPALAGSGDYLPDSGLLTIRGAGVDIWDTADQFQFAYQSWTGDAVVIARVDSLRNTSTWAKAGVMIRESLAPGARHATVVLTPGNGVAFQRRTTTDGGSLNTAFAGVTAPGWVKIERWGDRFDGFYSADGLTWKYLGSETMAMSATVYIGLAVTSHNPNALTEAVFSHFDYHTTGMPGGLWGEYFSGKAFNTSVLQRLDGMVDFNWGAGSPASAVPVDGFSARWTGWVTPDVTQSYTFSTVSDDGVRLWVNDQLLIDNWTNHGATENTGALTLAAGTAYSIKMEYYENTGGATARLLWAAVDRGKAPIAAFYLTPAQYPDSDGDGLPDYWEKLHGLDAANPADAATLDSQGHGLTYLQEYLIATHPDSPDTDGDGVPDIADPYPLDYYNGVAPTLTVVGGDQQSAQAGSFNAAPFDVAVWKADGSGPLVNAPLTFTVTSGGGLLAQTTSSIPALSLALHTDADGTAQIYYQQPTVSGVTSQITVAAGISDALFTTTSIPVPAPANLAAEAVSQTQINLSWSGDSSATSYTIERQATDGSYQVIATVDDALSYSDTGLSAGQTYHYRIKAKTNGATSDYSVPITVTTVIANTGQPPTVALAIDYGSSNFAEPGSISLTAEATSPMSTISKVDFYAGATKIGTSTGTPYQFEWNDVPSGTYGITAVATDANGLAGTSDIQWANVDTPSLPPMGLPYATDFEASESYSIGPLDHQNSWIVSWVSTGGVMVINTDAFSGTQAIEVQPDPLYTAVTQNFTSDPSIPVVYVDFYAKPTAADDPAYSASFWTESVGISIKRTGNLGEIDVYDADVYAWIGTGVTVPLNENGQTADWVRFTIRTDYGANTWDLYVNGHMLIADIPAYYASNMSQFFVVGNDSEPTLLDHFSAGYTNPLFADINNDGLDDVWEQANGLSLSVDSRQGVQADGSNNLQVYLNSNAVVLGVNLTPPVITSLVDSSGVSGAGGLVSVLVTGSDGSPITYAPVVFTVNGNGALIASASGSGGDSRITVQTDASGVARAYVNFTSSSPVDMLVMAQNSIISMATSATQIGASSSLPIHLVPPVIIDFEQAEGYLLGSLDQQQGWSVVQGAASISNQDAYSGSNSIVIEAGAKILQATLPPLPGKDIVYVDFYAKPSVEDDITKSTTFEIGGARFAFVTSYGGDDGQHATLEAFTGDGQGGGAWAPNSSDINLGWGNVSLTWVRLTARLNYSKKTWDLYLNGKMIATDLGLLDNTITALTSFSVIGSADYQSKLDHIYVGSTNLLFADANNDGIDDPWESQYSLSLSVNDRDLHPSGSNTSVVQAYVEGLDPNDFFEGDAPIISSTNSSGAVGAQGLVSIKITNADGASFVNGKVSVSSTIGASQVSSSAGESGSSQVTVTTDANGIAQVYVAFTTSDPNDIMSIALPDNGTWANPGTATKITLSNPLLPVMMAEIIGADASKYGVYASQYLFSIPDGWNAWDPFSHRTFLPTSPQKYYRTMTIASGIGTVTALDGTQTSSGPFTSKYTMVDEQTPITYQNDAPYWFPGDVGQTIIDSVTSAHFNTLKLDLFQKGTTAIFPHVTMELGDEYTTTELIANGLASGGAFTGNRQAVDYVSLSYGLHPEETQFDNNSAQFQFVWNTEANLNVPLTATWLITYTPFSVSGQPDSTPVCTTVTAPVVDGKTELQTFVPPRDKYGYYTINYIAAAMAVDANRDGQIKEDASDATSTDKPFRFWINDDDDAHTTFQRADSTTATVDGVDDLKDFFPVFLDIKKTLAVLPPDSGYTYTLKQADGALDFAYTSLTRPAAFSYLNAPYTYATADTRQVTAAGVQLDPVFLNTIKNGTQEEGVILCEGNKPSQQPLVLVVEKDGVEVTEVSLQMSTGARILLLLHGMNSNISTWDNLVNATFGSTSDNSGVIQDGQILNGTPPKMNDHGVRCYRLQFGAYDLASTRVGLEGVSSTNTTGYSNYPARCGDFETFDQLGQEVDDAITALLDPSSHPENKYAQIVLVGHSRGGLSARAFLEGSSTNKSAVVGLLTTSSPHLGSRIGQIYNWLSLHPRHVFDSEGNELLVALPGSQIGDPLAPINWQDWSVVDWLKQDTVNPPLPLPPQPKTPLDVRRPVIMDVANGSAALTQLNSVNALGNLPAGTLYGEIVYDKVDLGLMSLTPVKYSVFNPLHVGDITSLGLGPVLSDSSREFLLGQNNTPATFPGDGLIPAGNQVFTQMAGFPTPPSGMSTNKIQRLIVTTDEVVHTDAPSRTNDLITQLRLLTPNWFQ